MNDPPSATFAATFYAFTAAHESGIALTMPRDRLVTLRDALHTQP